jgi:tetratricopeptide (TPR) repeat protein
MTMRTPKNLLILCAVATLIAASSIGCHSNSASANDRAIRHDTAKARALNDQAFALLAKDKYDDAAKLLKQANEADVMFGPAHNNLGLVYYHQNRLYEAAWEFQNAIKLMPYQPEPRNNLGLVLERAGKMDPATDNYAKAVEMEPDNPEFLGNLARAKVRRGDRDEQTKKLLEELVMKDPRPDWNNWARGILFRINRPSDLPNGPPTGAPQVSPPLPPPITR